ncbi:MAG: hypothetical protein HKL99_10875 [Burkholderiales bacterium]|nr:hypothetical protein [Burkholderiales bacterium]
MTVQPSLANQGAGSVAAEREQVRRHFRLARPEDAAYLDGELSDMPADVTARLLGAFLRQLFEDVAACPGVSRERKQEIVAEAVLDFDVGVNRLENRGPAALRMQDGELVDAVSIRGADVRAELAVMRSQV